MAQPTPEDANGVRIPDGDAGENGHVVAASGKRKRDSDNGDRAEDGGDEMDVDNKVELPNEDESKTQESEEDTTKSKELIKAFVEVLRSFDIGPSILGRPLSAPESESEDEPHAKRQKSAEPPMKLSITDKVAADAYTSLDAIAADLASAVKASLSEMDLGPSDPGARAVSMKRAAQINEFRDRAMDLLRREKAYPNTRQEPANGEVEVHTASEKSEMVLSLVGYAPQERRLFSSLPLSKDVDLSDLSLPPGVSITRVIPSNPQDRTQTLGELFAPPRPLPPLQPPKQPKTQAKGNRLDFYHPHLTDSSRYRGNSYFNTKLSTGYYLDYSQATPSWQTKTKQHERAQSLAGRKPSLSELEMSEMETLFRGAFSTFAPCKDDTAAVVPSSVAGRLWWQRSGKQSFQRMIEVEYYGDLQDAEPVDPTRPIELDETAVQEAIDNWDETVVDPSLDDVMGSKHDEQDKEVDEILEEVSDLIETLASYQRIRNLTLPNSQNRQSSDPINGDMLANAGPQPSEEEQATYLMLKAQLALIIKTLPPYAVAKLNGDQLDDLLISTKIMVHTDQYSGTMDEDEASAQARLKAQQQAAQAAQANARQPQRTPSVSAVPYPNQYAAAANQYGTPARPAPQPQQYYRPTPAPNYQQPRNLGPPAPPQQRPPQPNQYTRTNGYPNQYATQLAKAQTPYGHQSLPQQYATQQRPNYGQMPQQGVPNARYNFQQGYQHQPGTPQAPANYGTYANSPGAIPARTMSPQVGARQAFSPSPAVPQNQGYSAPAPTMASQMNRFPSGSSQTGSHSQSPGLTGYHTVIPEAQQQRILDQAKARVAAQERSAMFADRLSQTNTSGLSGMGLGVNIDASRIAAIRANMANQNKPQSPTPSKPGGMNGTPGTSHVPYKVTPVPVPVIPTLQRKPTS
ncbi:hypothetical protein ACSS6W_002836 [Trichoderma asperelloides]|uniref:Uncharacterized protein n=1 Tax=Trichoderma asperellum TaxID=101201 RepID=A0A6V8QSZ5_TRIAP|nr:hypothetical protein LI328DRAFT_127008 [Trichoderma asperelloides]GFP54936.1 hypothetical protein TASIC1_0004056100 [Trichoderma asperellum]